MTDIRKLKQKRAQIKGQVSRINTFCDTHAQCTVAEAQVRIKTLESCWQKFEAVQERIDEEAPEDKEQAEAHLQEGEGERQLFEARYYAIASRAQEVIENKN